MAKNAEVDRWFEATKHPLENAMQCVRDIVLGADARISETIQDGTVSFGYLGDLASFVKLDEPNVTLVFARGGKFDGAFPHLLGSGPTRFMRFTSIEDVRAQATELRGIAVAWCKLLSTGGEMPVSTAKLPVAKKKRKPKAKQKPKQKLKLKPKPKPKLKPKPKPKKKAAKKKR